MRSSGGTAVCDKSFAKRQRFAKRQPGGMSLSAGTTPSIAGNSDLAGVSGNGTEAIKPRV